jgi:hypothetical protein
LIRFHPSTTSLDPSGTAKPLRRPRLGHQRRTFTRQWV